MDEQAETMRAPRKTPPLPWAGIALAIAAAMLGGVLAMACLVFKPVRTVATPPAENARGAGLVYYVQGSRDAAKAKAWTLKRARLLVAEPGEIVFNEDELNAWFADSRHTRQAARRAGEWLGVGQPDFRIADGGLQIAAPATVRALFVRATILVQMRGGFARADGGAAAPGIAGAEGLVMFAPREVYAGSLPLHKIPGARAFLLARALGGQTPPADAMRAWRKIVRADISGGRLRLLIK